MTAKDAISPYKQLSAMAGEPSVMGSVGPTRTVDASEPLVDVLPKLLEAPTRELRVAVGDREIGVVDTRSMLEALGRMIVARDDCSMITVECHPADYSASAIARAVEDADAHLVDLWSAPADDGNNLRVTLRVRLDNPEAAVRSLGRYGYHVTEASGHATGTATIEEERLSALQVYLNV